MVGVWKNCLILILGLGNMIFINHMCKDILIKKNYYLINIFYLLEREINNKLIYIIYNINMSYKNIMIYINIIISMKYYFYYIINIYININNFFYYI